MMSPVNRFVRRMLTKKRISRELPVGANQLREEQVKWILVDRPDRAPFKRRVSEHSGADGRGALTIFSSVRKPASVVDPPELAERE
jgi:hypothetical protein